MHIISTTQLCVYLHFKTDSMLVNTLILTSQVLLAELKCSVSYCDYMSHIQVLKINT